MRRQSGICLEQLPNLPMAIPGPASRDSTVCMKASTTRSTVAAQLHKVVDLLEPHEEAAPTLSVSLHLAELRQIRLASAAGTAVERGSQVGR